MIIYCSTDHKIDFITCRLVDKELCRDLVHVKSRVSGMSRRRHLEHVKDVIPTRRVMFNFCDTDTCPSGVWGVLLGTYNKLFNLRIRYTPYEGLGYVH